MVFPGINALNDHPIVTTVKQEPVGLIVGIVVGVAGTMLGAIAGNGDPVTCPCGIHRSTCDVPMWHTCDMSMWGIHQPCGIHVMCPWDTCVHVTCPCAHCKCLWAHIAQFHNDIVQLVRQGQYAIDFIGTLWNFMMTLQ